MDCAQGYVFFLVVHHEFSIFISLSPDLNLRPYWWKVWKTPWVSFFLMIMEKKCLSSSSFLLGFCEMRRKVHPKARRDLNVGILSSSGHLWKSQASSCSHTCASPCPAPSTERSLLGSSLLPIFLWPGLLSLPEENINGLHELMYRILSWGQEQTYISRVIYLWLLLKQMNRNNYLS